MKNYEFYKHTPVYTIRQLLDFCAENYDDREAFVYLKKDRMVSVSFEAFKDDVRAVGSDLFRNGFRNCHIAVLGENSYEWILTWFAVVCSGSVIVPIDKDMDPDGIETLVRDSECRVMVYSDTYADIAEKLQEKEADITYINMKDLHLIIGRDKASSADVDSGWSQMNICADDLASIVYTSGTTGKSKGVMLQHNNFCSCMYGACCNVQLTGTSILILPLHHTFGLVAGVLAVMYYGQTVYINRSLKRLPDDFKRCCPQNLFAVPLIVETLYQNIWSAARKQRKEKLLKRMLRISDILRKCGIDLRKVFFRSVMEAFGGKLDLIVSGGAPIDEKYIFAFQSFGITVLNGYGITECGPIVAVNRNHFFVSGSVGLPLCCNEVRISEEGEILVKGENVMSGYYHNDAENEKAFDGEWFKTGDIGFLDKYGALHIIGRIKNLIILGNGENIAAEFIEQEVLSLPYVKEVVAYGRNNKIVAEVFLDEAVTDAKERLDADIQMINKRLPHTHNIGQTIVRETEFPKTTTKKIKRGYGGE